MAAIRREQAATGSPTIGAWADYLAGEALAGTDPDAARPALDAAVGAAAAVGNRLVEGVALVAGTACRGRHGDPAPALRPVAAASGTGTGRATGPTSGRRCAPPRCCCPGSASTPTAVRLAAAVAAVGPPAYGAEAADLAAVDAAARVALGPERVAAAAAAGAALGAEGAVLLALQATAG